MRCADAGIAPAEPIDYESIVGEPPTVIERRSADQIVAAVEASLADVQVLRVMEPEWLENMPGAERFRAAVDAFEARGGRVERGS
jgi:hypothetical protein